jgi:hypothetical protein
LLPLEMMDFMQKRPPRGECCKLSRSAALGIDVAIYVVAGLGYSFRQRFEFRAVAGNDRIKRRQERYEPPEVNGVFCVSVR